MEIVMKQAEVGYGVSHQSMELAEEKCRQAMRACIVSSPFLSLSLSHSFCIISTVFHLSHMIYYFLPTRALIWNANKDHLLVKIFLWIFSEKKKI